MPQGQSGGVSTVAHGDQYLTAAASLVVGGGFFALWFWLLPQWFGLVAKPVVSGDDAFLIAARHDVLICSSGQCSYEVVLHRRALGDLTTADFIMLILVGGADLVAIDRCKKGCASLRAQIKSQNAMIKQVFLKVEPTFGFGVILEIAITLAYAVYRSGVICDVKI